MLRGTAQLSNVLTLTSAGGARDNDFAAICGPDEEDQAEEQRDVLVPLLVVSPPGPDGGAADDRKTD